MTKQQRRYEAWMRAYSKSVGGSVKGMCGHASRVMKDAFPELRVATGMVETSYPQYRWRPHSWCIAPDGKIVDPTAAQFENKILKYEEFTDDVIPA